jgi:hypothetical protein
MALLIAGLTLVWKRSAMLQELLTSLVMFANSAILPLSHPPSWVSAPSQPVFLTYSFAALLTTLLDGRPIATWGTGCSEGAMRAVRIDGVPLMAPPQPARSPRHMQIGGPRVGHRGAIGAVCPGGAHVPLTVGLSSGSLAACTARQFRTT